MELAGSFFRYIYCPDYGNSITVDIEFATLDKNAALSNAKGQMEMTFGVINGNNQQIEQFNESVEATIENALAVKRKELIEFYG